MPDHTIEPYIPVDFDFACGCHLSVHDEDRYCENHTHIAVQREGASLRTGDELGRRFLEDTIDLLTGPATLGVFVMPRDLTVCIEQLDEDFADAGWLDNDDLREEMVEHERHLEGELASHGWSVEWDDGYRIWRPTGDNPVAEMRHQREVNP